MKNDVGKTMLSRDGSKRGVVKMLSERHCSVCGRCTCYIVDWEDGRRTKPCAAAVKSVGNDLQIV